MRTAQNETQSDSPQYNLKKQDLASRRNAYKLGFRVCKNRNVFSEVQILYFERIPDVHVGNVKNYFLRKIVDCSYNTPAAFPEK